MKKIKTDISIIGAGLTGLVLANLLQSEDVKVILVEARERLGGRIFTKYNTDHPPKDMGATWFGKKHTSLAHLLEKLDVGSFEQVLGPHAIYEPISTSPPQLVSLPPNDAPSFRIQGGSSALIQTLANNLNADAIFMNQQVTSIEKSGNVILAKTASHAFQSKMSISTLPPFLLTSSINFSPALPSSLLKITKQTHTWMGESIKVGLSYSKPFWRAKNLSGNIFSNVGPISEMYDHSNVEDNAFALKGFFNGAYFSVSKEERLKLVLKQLEKYFGAQARDYLKYEEAVWRSEPFTYSPYSSPILPHQNNGHPVFQQAFMDGMFYVAGAETASVFPGYMEGAVRSAEAVYQSIKQQLSAV